MKKNILYILLFILVLSCTPAVNNVEVDYIGNDTDLLILCCAYGVDDLQDGMWHQIKDLDRIKSQVTNNIKISVLWQGIKEPSTYDYNRKGTHLYDLGGDSRKYEDFKDFDDRNQNWLMTEKTKELTNQVNWVNQDTDINSYFVLADFLSWAYKYYNVTDKTKIVLLMSDHGAGAYCDNSDDLLLKEMGRGLCGMSTVNFAYALHKGGRKIDVVVADVCLNGNIHDAYELRGLVDYFVATSNISTDIKYYQSFAYGLTENLDMKKLALGVFRSSVENHINSNLKYLGDNYDNFTNYFLEGPYSLDKKITDPKNISYFTNQHFSYQQTVFDISKVETVAQNFKKLTEMLNASSELTKLCYDTEHSLLIPRHFDGSIASTKDVTSLLFIGTYNYMVDIGYFCQMLRKYGTLNNEQKTTISNMEHALEEFHIATWRKNSDSYEDLIKTNSDGSNKGFFPVIAEKLKCSEKIFGTAILVGSSLESNDFLAPACDPINKNQTITSFDKHTNWCQFLQKFCVNPPIQYSDDEKTALQQVQSLDIDAYCPLKENGDKNIWLTVE